MEATNAGDQQAFLEEFLSLIDRSEAFLREHGDPLLREAARFHIAHGG